MGIKSEGSISVSQLLGSILDQIIYAPSFPTSPTLHLVELG